MARLRKSGSAANTRRLGRELALKALFQVDVGKQPVSEVLDGALDQVRTPVYASVNQAVTDAQAAVREALAAVLDQASDHTVRQLKLAASAATTNLAVLDDKVGEIARLTASESPACEPEGAQERVHSAAAETDAALLRIAGRPSFQPKLMEAVTDAARARLVDIEEAFRRSLGPAVQTSRFVVSLVHGALRHSDDIDSRLSGLSAHWSLSRQAAVDRNILRLAAYELLFEPDIPTGATINEAVELAKKYSTEESGRFVNGVLGALAGNTHDQAESAA